MNINTFDKFIYIHEQKMLRSDINKIEKGINNLREKASEDLYSPIDDMLINISDIKKILLKHSNDIGIS